MWQVRECDAKTILTPVSGFLKEAGFTHSLSPARNCTYGCTYCYVPTMGIYGGLRPEDWERWGQFTTLKANAAELTKRGLRPDQAIYCSPLVDAYQPSERGHPVMPGILAAVAASPPAVFVLQTRAPLIVRDTELLRKIAQITKLRISFSITTDREDVRRRYEPRCEPVEERLAAIRVLREAGLEVYATLAPLLPCDPERLARSAIDASGRDLIGDPLHVRGAKPHGATTRAAAFQIAQHGRETEWFETDFQEQIIRRIEGAAKEAGHEFTTGPRGFGKLARR